MNISPKIGTHCHKYMQITLIQEIHHIYVIYIIYDTQYVHTILTIYSEHTSIDPAYN